MLRVASRLAADTILVALLLFTAARTIEWWRAWVLLMVMILVRAAGALAAYQVNPELLRDRAGLPIHGDQPRADRVLLLAVLATGFLGLPVIAGLDAAHGYALPRPAPVIAGAGLVLFALGWILKGLALRANAFATAPVRLQRERAHVVIDSGLYAIVRHPFYAADPFILVGLGLWLESYVAALAAAVPVTLMVIRLHLEERFLRDRLPGYDEYMTRVPYRLFPYIW